jgi:hypothetical protein
MILREIVGGDGRGWNSALEAKWGKRAKSKKELVKSRTCTAQTQVFVNAALDRVARTPSSATAESANAASGIGKGVRRRSSRRSPAAAEAAAMGGVNRSGKPLRHPTATSAAKAGRLAGLDGTAKAVPFHKTDVCNLRELRLTAWL